ncbi:MAG: cobalamin-dependent protein, partial [Pirellulales bacterium]|nr:cobalamin-dependent protein [Pirellulales bacterium]
MKILLIRYHDQANNNSREVKNVVGGLGVWPPLGLLYLAATLKENGLDVEVLDVLEQGLGSAGARERILKSGADLVGISTTTPEIHGTMEAACFAKEAGAKVVLGGPHLGIFLEETLCQDDVDFAIRGDGERPLLSLVQALRSCAPDLSKVPGLAYKDQGRIIANDVHIERELDSLPVPDWGLLTLRSYSRADALSPLATMISARGCPYHCGFCYRSPESMHMRFRDPVAVVDEMEALVKGWGVREIVFCNDTLTLQRGHI